MVNDIPAGDEKIAYLFLKCTSSKMALFVRKVFENDSQRPGEAEKKSDETEAVEAATSKAKAVKEHHDAARPDMCEDDPSLQKLGHFFARTVCQPGPLQS